MKKRLLILFPFQGGIDVHLTDCTYPKDIDADVATVAYRDHGDDLAEDLIVAAVFDHNPDVCLFSTACGLPMLETLAEVRQRCRLVHWCHDGACPDMHPTLQAYKDAETFDLSISTDGNRDWPQRPGDLTLQYPVHPGAYAKQKPVAERSIRLGFSGSWGDSDDGAVTTKRGLVLKALGDAVKTQKREGRPWPYAKHANFMLDCRAALNTAWCGTERALHCKTRVVEAGLAGCLLFETADSPTREWFVPGEDYLEYGASSEVVATMELVNFTSIAAEMGQRFREKTLALDPHGTFWRAVMGN